MKQFWTTVFVSVSMSLLATALVMKAHDYLHQDDVQCVQTSFTLAKS